MTKSLHTDHIVESLIESMLSDADSRQRHLFRENLRNLVRVAKAEQVSEIKDNVQQLSGEIDSQVGRRRAKAVLMAKRFPELLDQVQQGSESWH